MHTEQSVEEYDYGNSEALAKGLEQSLVGQENNHRLTPGGTDMDDVTEALERSGFRI
jgi:hypothetical protein